MPRGASAGVEVVRSRQEPVLALELVHRADSHHRQPASECGDLSVVWSDDQNVFGKQPMPYVPVIDPMDFRGQQSFYEPGNIMTSSREEF